MNTETQKSNSIESEEQQTDTKASNASKPSAYIINARNNLSLNKICTKKDPLVAANHDKATLTPGVPPKKKIISRKGSSAKYTRSAQKHTESATESEKIGKKQSFSKSKTKLAAVPMNHSSRAAAMTAIQGIPSATSKSRGSVKNQQIKFTLNNQITQHSSPYNAYHDSQNKTEEKTPSRGKTLISVSSLVMNNNKRAKEQIYSSQQDNSNFNSNKPQQRCTSEQLIDRKKARQNDQKSPVGITKIALSNNNDIDNTWANQGSQPELSTPIPGQSRYTNGNLSQEGQNNTGSQEEEIDPIMKRYLDYQERLREATGNPNAKEFQLICYERLLQKNFPKFRHTFFQNLPTKTNNIRPAQKTFQSATHQKEQDNPPLTENSEQKNNQTIEHNTQPQSTPTKDFGLKLITLQNNNFVNDRTIQNSQMQINTSNSDKSKIGAALNQMCLDNHKMALNLPLFYRCMVKNIRDHCNNNQLIFDYDECDKIVEAAMQDKLPIVTAKRWAISESKKGAVMVGKNQDDQSEIASMTKVATSYTVCRILDELGLYSKEQLQNIYVRTSRTAAFKNGTSAYLQTDNRLTLYDCLHALMIPSGNDAAIILATEFGRWLFLIGDKSKESQLPIVSRKGKINNYSNAPDNQRFLINQAFKFPNKGHEDYQEAFLTEMNRQATGKLRLKNCRFINPHGLQQKANHASASDVICLMYHAMKYDVLKEICGKPRYTCTVYTFDLFPRKFSWDNTNKLINEYFCASKTGITPSAGPCLVTHFMCGPYESQGCLIDSKTQEIRHKEMATLLLWQFDKYLKKNRLCGYNRSIIQKVQQLKQAKLEEKKAQEELLKIQESKQEEFNAQSPNQSPDKQQEANSQ